MDLGCKSERVENFHEQLQVHSFHLLHPLKFSTTIKALIFLLCHLNFNCLAKEKDQHAYIKDYLMDGFSLFYQVGEEGL